MKEQDENEYTSAFTGDFVNDEPVVFKGLTDAEVKQVFIISLVVGAPIGIVVALVIGIPMLIIVFVLIFPIIAVWFIAGWMERQRRGKPPGYMEHTFDMKLTRLKLNAEQYISTSYKWGLGRTKRSEGKK